MKKLLLLLVACRSAQTQYYTLVPPAGDAASVSTEFQLDVLPVDVPADVDRQEIVVRKSAGEVSPDDNHSWIAPLPFELRRAFGGALSHAVGARDVAGVASDAMPTYRVKLAVRELESVLGDRALIDAITTVREAGGATPPLVCNHRVTVKAKAGWPGLAEAHQAAVQTLAAEVAGEVKTIRAGQPACTIAR